MAEQKEIIISCPCGHDYKLRYKYRHDKRNDHIAYLQRNQIITLADIKDEKRPKRPKEIKARKCTDEECNKVRVFNTKYCLFHININDIQVDNKYKCIECIFAYKRSGFSKHCRTCFYYKYPTHQLSIKTNNYCSKERKVKNELTLMALEDKDFDGFVHNKPMIITDCDCTVGRRIDFRKQIGNTVLCIEVDENAHCGYDLKDNERRYNEIIFAYTCNYIFIRFNPDKTRRDKSTLADRIPRLFIEIKKQIIRINNGENSELLETIYLFYPNH
jgi:hypothetical protein